MAKNIYERDSYLNKSFDFIPSANIKEYDMKSGGLSIIMSKKLLSENQIEELKAMPKKQRNIQIGLIQRRDRELAKQLANGFREYRKMFFEANEIDESNVISIKKDAVILVNSKINRTVFDKVQFRDKNRYSSYYFLQNKNNGIELYYNRRDNILDIKGIDDNDLYLHRSMISFLKKVIKLNEVSNSSAKRYLYDFADRYRKRKLNKTFYREFKPDGKFRIYINLDTGSFLSDEIVDDDILIDINYNYKYVILPLIKMIF